MKNIIYLIAIFVTILSCGQSKSGIKGSDNDGNQIVIADKIEKLSFHEKKSYLEIASRDFLSKVTFETSLRYIEDLLGVPKKEETIGGIKQYVWSLKNVEIIVESSNQEKVDSSITFIFEDTNSPIDFYFVDGRKANLIPPFGDLRFKDLWGKSWSYMLNGSNFDANTEPFFQGSQQDLYMSVLLIGPTYPFYKSKYQYFFSSSPKRIYNCGKGTTAKINLLKITKTPDSYWPLPPKGWETKPDDYDDYCL